MHARPWSLMLKIDRTQMLPWLSHITRQWLHWRLSMICDLPLLCANHTLRDSVTCPSYVPITHYKTVWPAPPMCQSPVVKVSRISAGSAIRGLWFLARSDPAPMISAGRTGSLHRTHRIAINCQDLIFNTIIMNFLVLYLIIYLNKSLEFQLGSCSL